MIENDDRSVAIRFILRTPGSLPVLRSAPGIESSSQESLKSKEDIYKIMVNTLAALIYPTRKHKFEGWGRTKMGQPRCAFSACNEIVWGVQNHGESCVKCG